MSEQPEQAQLSRLEHLREMVEDLRTKMATETSGQNYSVMGRLRADLLKQIDELGGGVAEKPKETGLSDFEKRLAERQSGAKAPRRAKSG